MVLRGLDDHLNELIVFFTRSLPWPISVHLWSSLVVKFCNMSSLATSTPSASRARIVWKEKLAGASLGTD